MIRAALLDDWPTGLVRAEMEFGLKSNVQVTLELPGARWTFSLRTGQRLEISNNLVKVIDPGSPEVVRMQIGDLSA